LYLQSAMVTIMQILPCQDTVNKPYPGFGGEYPDTGCMFCVSLGGNEINRYNIHNDAACYISCQNPECKQKAFEITQSINQKIAEQASNFLKGGLIYTIDGKTYHINTEDGKSFTEMLGSNRLGEEYAYGVPDNTYMSAEYDYTDPREVTDDNFNVFLYSKQKEDGFWYKIYLRKNGVASYRCANFFPCK